MTKVTVRSERLFQRANELMPGGVNSPVRAFKAVDGIPPFISRGKGAYITDVDGNEYIDYVMSYGPLLFGHAPEFITEAIETVVRRGTVFGAPTEFEVELAELVTQLVPSMEKVRFVSTGTEATTSAIRLARGVTGRTKIIKCAGCFHGSVDSLLVSAGSGVATLGIPETAGVPEVLAAETIVVEYNDADALQSVFDNYGDQIAAFIVEPIPANMGVVLPNEGYLETARELTQKHNALLIFDEVITGFRVAPGGAQQLLDVTPDLTCVGKIVGGGTPCAAYGGRADIMDHLAPNGPVYQAGTLSGNPLVMAAGLAMLREIRRGGESLYLGLEDKGEKFADGISEAFTRSGIAVQVQRVGSILTPFFSDKPITNYTEAKQADTTAFKQFFHGLLTGGVYVPPSQYEAWFVSEAHGDLELELTLERIKVALCI